MARNRQKPASPASRAAPSSPKSKTAGPTATIRRVLEMEAAAIHACATRLGQRATAEAFRLALEILRASLDQGGKIVVTGVGKSGKVGEKIAATLCSTGSLAVFLHPTEGLHGDLGVVSPKDAILALSYSGNTDELVRLLPSLKSRRVSVIGIGGNARSKLAQHCDAWLDGSVDQEACPHNLAPTTSTTVSLAIGDALAIALMELRGFDSRSFAANHPGGALGRKLHLTVAEIMHAGPALAVLPPQAPIDEVVMALSEKRLGAVLIAQGPKLLGIITEGDIRRALQHRERFFKLRAREVMTVSPVTVRPEMLAQAALDLMEDRPHQIAVLPVVDSRGQWKGLVRLHDLVGSL